MLFIKKRAFSTTAKSPHLKLKLNKAKYVKTFIVFVPEVFSVLLLKSANLKWILVYDNKYKFILPVKSNYCVLSFGFTSSTLKLDTLLANSYYSTYISICNNLLGTFYKPLFRKIKFRGKGYYIYKNSRNTIAPQFGYSHRLYVYSYFNKVKFIGKTIVLLFGLTKNDIISAGTTLKSKRPINIFTGRGVRFSRQVVYKKQGKVSSYR